MKKFVISIILSFLIMISLSACVNKLTEGTIVDKEYQEEYSYVTYITIFNGKTSTLIPQVHTSPEKYIFYISGDIDGETITESHYTDPITYSKYEIGDFYVIEND